MTYLLQYHEMAVMNFNSHFQLKLIAIALTLTIRKLIIQIKS